MLLNRRNNFFEEAFSDAFFQPGFSLEPTNFQQSPFYSLRSPTMSQLSPFESFGRPIARGPRMQPMALTFDMDSFGQNPSFRQQVAKNLPVDPQKLKIKIDKKSNSLTINYVRNETDSQTGLKTYHQISQSQSLPKFIKENNLFDRVQCKFENGKVKVVLPKKPEEETIEKPILMKMKSDEKQVSQSEQVSIDLVSDEENKKDRECEVRSRGSSEKEDGEMIVMPGLE